MSTFADVQELYGGVKETWAKNRPHVFTHVVFALVLLGICRVTLPAISIPKVNPKQIMDNEWFKLAKETGLIYVSFVIPFVVIGFYVAVLRVLGRILVTTLFLLFPTERHNFRFVHASFVEPVAVLLGREDFQLSDLVKKAAELRLTYKEQNTAEGKAYQESLNQLTKNANVYLGDFFVMLLGWMIWFHFFPHAAWTHENEGRFWPVTLILAALIGFSWFRVSHVLAIIPALQLMLVAMTVRADPEMAAALEAPEDRRDRIQDRLQDLLQKEKEYGRHLPLIFHYLKAKMGWQSDRDRDSAVYGRPFSALYRRGEEFSWKKEETEQYNAAWLHDYVAYCYYRIHKRLSLIGRTLVSVARYMITGTPF